MTDTTASHYRRQSLRFSALIDALTTDTLAMASRCDGWTVRDVVEHVISTELSFLERMPFYVAPTTSIGSGSLHDQWALVMDAMQTALDNPAKAAHSYDGYFGATTFRETVDTFYVPDLLVHTWDIASAIGLAEFTALDPDDMARAKRLLEALGDNVRGPGVYGPPVELEGETTEQERFLAWTGRNPR